MHFFAISVHQLSNTENKTHNFLLVFHSWLHVNSDHLDAENCQLTHWWKRSTKYFRREKVLILMLYGYFATLATLVLQDSPAKKIARVYQWINFWSENCWDFARRIPVGRFQEIELGYPNESCKYEILSAFDRSGFRWKERRKKKQVSNRQPKAPHWYTPWWMFVWISGSINTACTF